MYVRAYLAIPCVSADHNVKHTKSNIRYDNKINIYHVLESHPEQAAPLIRKIHLLNSNFLLITNVCVTK